jgi:hypothetical protein
MWQVGKWALADDGNVLLLLVCQCSLRGPIVYWDASVLLACVDSRVGTAGVRNASVTGGGDSQHVSVMRWSSEHESQMPAKGVNR